MWKRTSEGCIYTVCYTRCIWMCTYAKLCNIREITVASWQFPHEWYPATMSFCTSLEHLQAILFLPSLAHMQLYVH
jgi:hypothetical protein